MHQLTRQLPCRLADIHYVTGRIAYERHLAVWSKSRASRKLLRYNVVIENPLHQIWEEK